MQLKYTFLLQIFLLFSCDALEEGLTEGNEATASIKYGDQKSAITLSITHCEENIENGVFELAASGNYSALNLKIKTFSTEPKTYTCTQAENNTSGSLGDFVHECYTTVREPNETQNNFYQYNMYRNETSMPAFTYGGSCTITISKRNESEIEGSGKCANMIRTYFNGVRIESIDTSAMQTVEYVFKCPKSNKE